MSDLTDRGLAFPLSRHWELRPLADVADILDSKRLPVNAKEREGRPGAIPYFGATGQVGWIDDWLFDEELVLLGEDGAPFLDSSKAKAYAVRGKAWVNNHAHVLRATHVPTGWLLHYLNAVDYRDLVTGTTRLKLTQGEMRKIKVPVAPDRVMIETVAEIEKQFSRLDDAVANLQRVGVHLRRYKAAVVGAAMDGFLVPNESELAVRSGATYESADKLLDRILKDRRESWNGRGKWKAPRPIDAEHLPKLPVGWIWSSFEAAAERVTVGHVGSMKDEYVPQGVPFLRSQNVRPNRFDAQGLKYVSPLFHSLLAKSALRPGDIAVVRSGSVGVSCVIPDSLPEANCSDLVIIKNPTGVLPAFGAYYLNSVIESRIVAGRVGVALVHFNTQSVAELPLPVPPLAEQRRIVAEVDRRLSIVREVETEVDANLKRAQALRQAVLQRAFSGQLVVSQPSPSEPRPALQLIPGTTSLSDSARAALSAEIVHQLHADATFGKVKHQKIFHLCEHVAQLKGLKVQYRRAGYGPLNLPMIEANDGLMEQQGWYAERLREGSAGHRYVQLSKAGGHAPYLACFSDAQLKTIRRLIDLMRGWKTEQCEMFSTVYAAWNDLLIMGREATPDAIVREVLELWDDKKKRFPRQQWLDQITWITAHGFVPTGFGHLTRSPTDGVTPDLFHDSAHSK